MHRLLSKSRTAVEGAGDPEPALRAILADRSVRYRARFAALYALLLRLRNERDEWELPGGKLEVGESPEEGVCREAAEELGLTITGVDIIDTWVYEITPVRHVFIVSFGAAYAGDERLAYSAEHKELGVFGYDEVPGLPMPEQYKRTIARWRKARQP